MDNAKGSRQCLDLLSAIITEGVRMDTEFDLGLDDDWVLKWPRPVTTPPEQCIKLKIKAGGIVDFGPWWSVIRTRYDNPSAPMIQGKAHVWLAVVNPSLDAAKQTNIIAIPLNRDKLGLDRSLWGQVLYHLSKQIEA